MDDRGSPFTARRPPAPVRIVANTDGEVGPGVAVIRLEAPLHRHDAGSICPVCESRGDIRVALFDLMQRERLGAVPPFSRVVVDASGSGDIAEVTDALIPGRRPALGLRDIAVARSFYLEGGTPAPVSFEE